MIEEAYISFDTAKLAKEKGFDEPCLRFYSLNYDVHNSLLGLDNKANYISNSKWDSLRCDITNNISAPTQSLLARWLREKHNMCVEVYCIACNFIWNICKTDGTDTKSSEYSGPNDGGAWDSYEDAMENGLQEALKML